MMYRGANWLLDDPRTFEQLEQNALIQHNHLMHVLVNTIETNHHQIRNEIRAIRDSVEAGNNQLTNTLQRLTEQVTQRLGTLPTTFLLTYFK